MMLVPLPAASLGLGHGAAAAQGLVKNEVCGMPAAFSPGLGAPPYQSAVPPRWALLALTPSRSPQIAL